MTKYRFDQIALNSTEKKKPVEEDRFTYLGLEHLDSGSLKVARYGSEVAPIGEKLVMRKGDVLFGKRRAYQKKVAIAPFDGIFSAHGMVLRPKEDVVDKDFFPLFISSDYFLDAAIKISVGSLSPTINWRDLKELEFELPDLESQKRLASTLWAMNETMDSYKELIAATDELVKSQFIEQIEGHYSEIALGDEIETTSGGTPSRKKSEYYDEGDIPWLTSGEVNRGIINSVNAFITKLGLENSSAKWVPAGSVVIAMYGATAGAVGLLEVPTTTNQAVCSLLPSEKFDPFYLYQAVCQKREWMIASTNGAAQPNISQTIIKKMRISKPPMEVQKSFSEIVRQSDKSKFELKKALSELTATYKRIIKENIG